MARALYIEKDITGEVVVQPPRVSPDWKSPVCFFLHGYNVDPQGAYEAYGQLTSTIGRETSLPTLLSSQSWVVCWRSYVDIGLASGKSRISALTYAQQIPSAVLAASALRSYVDGECGTAPVSISIVAHSLGSRMALELLDDYAQHPGTANVEFASLILLAAAVPTHFLENLVALWQGALLPKKTLVLFSGKDIVLAGPFRAGETIAGEGFFPRAVGATGHPPTGFWTEVESTANDHSGYFHDRVTARHVARFLGSSPALALPESTLGALTIQRGDDAPELRPKQRRLAGERIR